MSIIVLYDFLKKKDFNDVEIILSFKPKLFTYDITFSAIDMCSSFISKLFISNANINTDNLITFNFKNSLCNGIFPCVNKPTLFNHYS